MMRFFRLLSWSLVLLAPLAALVLWRTWAAAADPPTDAPIYGSVLSGNLFTGLQQQAVKADADGSY